MLLADAPLLAVAARRGECGAPRRRARLLPLPLRLQVLEDQACGLLALSLRYQPSLQSLPLRKHH